MAITNVDSALRYIIIYGKGGVGKTSTMSNLAAALQQLDQRPMLVGCSPKSSLMDLYNASSETPTILDLFRSEGLDGGNINKAIWRTKEGVLIAEAGGPEPGIGCAGNGLIRALGDMEKYKQYVEGMDGVSYMLYDVIGDVVCGGFAVPMRGPGSREVLVVTSGELMSLYSANNIIRSVVSMQESGAKNLRVAGLIANYRGVPFEEEILASFSQATNTPVLATIPRNPGLFKAAERLGGPITQVYPDSTIAQTYRKLASDIHGGAIPGFEPTPIERYEDLFDLFMGFQETQSETSRAEIGEDYRKRLPTAVVNRDAAKRISIYGTGGIGKSTVSANVTAALALLGERVYQIGCDPKRDSIATLCGELKPTILHEKRRMGILAASREFLEKLVYEAPGYAARVYGSECGGPPPGKGCAGKGVDMALVDIETHKIVEDFVHATFVIYDVLGDTVCGGFARPLKYTRQTYIVTSGELATIISAMKIAQSVDSVAKKGLDVGIAGIINNCRGVPYEREMVEEIFGALGLPVIHHVPRSKTVQEAENLKKTVVLAFSESDQAAEYMTLAAKIRDSEASHLLSRPILSRVELQQIVGKYQAPDLAESA
ncbi:MAG: ArsA-related P-loop ATPase [Dehalococcoidia bacterium]|nr:ArsA-related P-loop ATPase [Dehalococcoidia bacterium]